MSVDQLLIRFDGALESKFIRLPALPNLGIACPSAPAKRSESVIGAVQMAAMSSDTAKNGSDKAHRMPVRARPNQGRNTTSLQQHSCRVPGRNRRRRHFERLRDGCASNQRRWNIMSRSGCGFIVRRNGAESLELLLREAFSTKRGGALRNQCLKYAARHARSFFV